ncbi:SH3 domain-containing protein [Limnobacter humi]|uniref:SH3 domain-containing protein n=1 Tax=Limnobacter humi TaxID=1778671 RepID=A0ABT1WFJ1_9BURK|nr:SH3 domain-containing protein [Limnobacter humi]MCQ8896278.1 SH3 domain-containing protein [Limnobacter humi]
MTQQRAAPWTQKPVARLAASLVALAFTPLNAAAQIQPTLMAQVGSALGQVAQRVENVGKQIVGIPDAAELLGDERPVALLQVFTKRIVVRSEPSSSARGIGEFFKGQLVDAFEEKDGWYRVRIQGSLLGGSVGWVQQTQGDYGDMALGLFAPRVFPHNPLLDPQTDSSLRPSTTATAGSVPESVPRAIPGRAQSVPPRDIAIPVIDPSQVPPPQPNLPRETVSVPDRWRIMQSLGFKFPIYDPYNQNPIKADLPVLRDVLGPDWFFNLNAISDTLYEERRFPVPVPPVTSTKPGQTSIFGGGDQSIFAQNLIVSLSLIKGNTTFRPPDYEFRLVPVFNYTDVRVQEDRLLKISPTSGTERKEGFVGIQEAFADIHLRNVSDRYDFDSLRVGIQPFISDFRGFLFQDLPIGVRLFGNRDNNRTQYNLGYFKRIEKDTNSGLNDIRQPLRDDDFLVANLYRQDFPVVGFTSQVSYIHNRNHENDGRYFDANGFQVRPASIGDQKPFAYHVDYFGFSGDGHFGRTNITTSTYYATGKVERDPIAQRELDISAWFHATEVSRDFDWMRVRGSFLYASGDKDPFDGKAEGFDAIFENPQFAGADTSFWIRQNIPLVGGGGVALSGRNGVLPSLRSSKEQGQSNFVNPGLLLLGIGADLDVLPELRIVSNLNKLQFEDTTVLGVLRQQRPPSRDIGYDASVGFQYRPFFTQNVVVNGSIARLFPGDGYKDLFGADNAKRPYSLLFNVLLTF